MKRLFCIVSLFWIQTLMAQPSPLPMLEQTSQHILATLKQHQGQLKSQPKLIHQAIEQDLLPHVDVKGMSRSVLGRAAWQHASAEEKQAFTQAFTQLVIRTYASPLAEYSGETVAFLPLRDATDGKFVRVNSVISRPNGQRIPLSYHLVSQQGTWKIYDLSIEGVSLLQSFRSQFGSMMQHESMSAVIAHLKKRTVAS